MPVCINNVNSYLSVEQGKKRYLAKGKPEVLVEMKKLYEHAKGEYQIVIFPLNSEGVHVIKPTWEL